MDAATIIRERAFLAASEADPEERARIFREIEKIAADAAHRIEHEVLEAQE